MEIVTEITAKSQKTAILSNPNTSFLSKLSVNVLCSSVSLLLKKCIIYTNSENIFVYS